MRNVTNPKNLSSKLKNNEKTVKLKVCEFLQHRVSRSIPRPAYLAALKTSFFGGGHRHDIDIKLINDDDDE